MIHYIQSDSTNPHYNLALEQHVFDNLSRENNYFMLWQNANTLVVGKYQNTFAEINHSYVNENNVRVVRRLSGGGAVYHDLGNLNFTFITDQDQAGTFNFKYFCEPIVKTLQKFGVPAEIHGRNDIVIEEKKFSGNSQYAKQGRVMHHGTIMFDVDLSVLSKALAVSKDKIESKGVTSVRSRVTNIIDYLPDKNITLDDFSAELLKTISEVDALEHYKLTENDQKLITDIQKDRYDKWDWNYGSSPEHSIHKSRRIPSVGKIDVYMNVKNGKIENTDFFGDFFGQGGEKISEKLKGITLDKASIKEAVTQQDVTEAFQHLTLDAFTDIITE